MIKVKIFTTINDFSYCVKIHLDILFSITDLIFIQMFHVIYKLIKNN
jgi:hypothetical protein